MKRATVVALLVLLAACKSETRAEPEPGICLVSFNGVLIDAVVISEAECRERTG